MPEASAKTGPGTLAENGAVEKQNQALMVRGQSGYWIKGRKTSTILKKIENSGE